MKTLLLSIVFLGVLPAVFAQNIDDNRISFNYVQLPYIKVDKLFTKYDLKVVHGYQQGNQDMLAAHETNKQIAFQVYEQNLLRHNRSVDSINTIYYRLMAQWEKDVNAGKLGANGLALPQPATPIYPVAPMFPVLEAPRLNTPLDENTVLNGIGIQGFERGFGGIVVTVNILSLSNIFIEERKTGSGTTTKYTYTATYRLPVEVTVESPTQGKLIFLRILEGTQTYKIGEYSSAYDYKLHMLQNKERVMNELEAAARAQAIRETNDYLNNQIGYVNATRTVEIYAVKSYKNYEYSDVTAAYTKTVQALQLVSQDRNRASAIAAIDEALKMWGEIMEESNTVDNKARINDKITAMIQCNMAELHAWKGNYDGCDLNYNLAINEGGKFKRHANDHKGFFSDQRKRWNAHY